MRTVERLSLAATIAAQYGLPMTPHDQPLDLARSCHTAMQVLRATRDEAIRAASEAGATPTVIATRTGLSRTAIRHALNKDGDQ